MGEARTDAGSASVVTDGSIAMRDIDLATRLETEILDSMRSGFNQANNLKQEGRTRKMTDQARINGYKTNAGSTLLSGFDTTVSQTSDASLGWYKYYDALSKREQGKQKLTVEILDGDQAAFCRKDFLARFEVNHTGIVIKNMTHG